MRAPASARSVRFRLSRLWAGRLVIVDRVYTEPSWTGRLVKTARYDRRVDLYGQEAEAGLLAACLVRLDERSAVDVGAERGSLVAEFLAAGSPSVHAIEPDADNVADLRASFGDDPRVTIHACAAGREDGKLELRKAVDSTGASVSFGHTVLELPDADETAWRETVTVPARSIASLVAGGELPRRVGILKIDTEGHDLAVVAGLGELECDVLMVEHWTDLPHSLGRCPWSAEEMTAALRVRGFSNFAFVAHHAELTLVQWNDAHIAAGQMGNLVFLHDRVVERLLPVVLDCAMSVAVATVARLELERDGYAQAATERLDVIDKLARERDEYATVASERHGVIREFEARVEELRGEAELLRAHLVEEAVSRARIVELERVCQGLRYAIWSRDAALSAARGHRNSVQRARQRL